MRELGLHSALDVSQVLCQMQTKVDVHLAVPAHSLQVAMNSVPLAMVVMFQLQAVVVANRAGKGNMQYQVTLRAQFAMMAQYLLLKVIPVCPVPLVSTQQPELLSVLLVHQGLYQQPAEVLAALASQGGTQQLGVRSVHLAVQAQHQMKIRALAYPVWPGGMLHLAIQIVWLALAVQFQMR